MKKVKSFRNFNKFKGKGPKGKDPFTFVRFGGLDSKNQEGYSKKTFHAPPAPRGIYAFPKITQELFLIGSMNDFNPGIHPKEPDWNKINQLSKEEQEKAYKDYQDRKSKINTQIRKEFRKTSGYIWHHLGDNCKASDIVSKHGSWVKTDMESWAKAFRKESLQDRYGDFNAPGEESLKINTVNKARGISGMHSKDHYEVFFDEKV